VLSKKSHLVQARAVRRRFIRDGECLQGFWARRSRHRYGYYGCKSAGPAAARGMKYVALATESSLRSERSAKGSFEGGNWIDFGRNIGSACSSQKLRHPSILIAGPALSQEMKQEDHSILCHVRYITAREESPRQFMPLIIAHFLMKASYFCIIS
jgi:hypothetical protein